MSFVSDHTQAIPKVGGAEAGTRSQDSKSAGDNSARSTNPATPAVSSNGSASSGSVWVVPERNGSSNGQSPLTDTGRPSSSQLSDRGFASPTTSLGASTAQRSTEGPSSYQDPTYSDPTSRSSMSSTATVAPSTTSSAAAHPTVAAPTGLRTNERPWDAQPGRPIGGAAAAPTTVVPPAVAGQPATADATKAKNRSNQRGTRGPRKARLQLRHVDTWSALKISLVLAIVMFFVWMVAVGILYGVLSGLDVFDEINKLWGQLGSEEGGTSELITPGLVFGGAALIGAINIVLFTALSTISTYIYNLSADLVGGLEVTLSERE